MALAIPSMLTGMGVAAGTAATIGTIANIGLTAASAFSFISGGIQQSQALRMQSRQAALNARLERIQGKQEGLNIQNQLEKDLASQNAIFAARGGLMGEGSALAAQETARKQATQAIDTARFNAEIGALGAEQRASNLKSEARSAQAQGFMKAGSAVLSYKPLPKTTLLSGI